MPPKKRSVSSKAAAAAAAASTEDDGPSVEVSAGKKSARIASTPAKGQITSGSITVRRIDSNGLITIAPLTVDDASSEIVGFDMDDTLIETKSGKVFAVGRGDWKWLFDSVPAKLKEIHASGKRIVIFSNQSGIAGKGFDESKANMLSGKIADLMADVGFPFYAFMATSDDEYRKPSTGMWDACEELFGKKLNKSKCMYVGDAAGRPAGWKAGRKKDFSCSDRKFAYNVGIEFQTPEMFFKGEKDVAFDWDGLGPNDLPKAELASANAFSNLASSSPELVLLVGFPASGKSTFAKRYFVTKGYVWVNRDTMKTQDKCLKAARESLSEGKSVIVDNTNPSKDARAEYIAAAKSAGVPCRCFWLQTSEHLAKHLNMFRERMGISDHVPGIGYNIYKKNYADPTMDEGFSEIRKIDFVPQFEDPKSLKIFSQLA